MAYFAVIDTETNWSDQVMSIGTVIGEADSFRLVDSMYQLLTPELQIGGMYEGALYPEGLPYRLSTREEALLSLIQWLKGWGVSSLFAYNACFDWNHLPELQGFAWFDIIRLAAYRQSNPAIPSTAPCCTTGRLKRGYGVEAMLGLLSGDSRYRETHNALYDAMDELRIMKLLGHPLSAYPPLK